MNPGTLIRASPFINQRLTLWTSVGHPISCAAGLMIENQCAMVISVKQWLHDEDNEPITWALLLTSGGVLGWHAPVTNLYEVT